MFSDQDQELWKVEPVSPTGTSPLNNNDDWLFSENNVSDITNDVIEPLMYDEHPTRAQVATKLLEELDEWIKEEPFSDWLEEKIDLPIFDELPVPECGQNKPIVYPVVVKAQQQETTQTLLQEFENILGDVEACHRIVPPIGTTLTPPQSPPPPQTRKVQESSTGTQLLVTLQPVQSVTLVPYEQSIYHPMSVPVGKSAAPLLGQITTGQCKTLQVQWNAENISLEPLGGDVASELAAVDEFVRSCAEDISPSSPCTSSGGSYVSSEDSVDDPDWMPEVGVSSEKPLARPIKNRRKPYSRPTVEDKKIRKKEQNKNAATRYRQKKKQEVEEILGEERELADYNDKLQGQVNDLQREIGYLKGLMRDLFRAKGLMK